MTTKPPSPSWWHKPATMKPLEAVKVALCSLEANEPVPGQAAAILAKGLRMYLAGQPDITANLGLRARRGGRNQTPVARELADSRNEHIRALFEAQSGGKCAKAKKVADLLAAGPTNEITEADVLGHLVWLNERFGDGSLPTSFRRILGIVDGQ